MKKYIYSLKDQSCLQQAIGGKATSLARMLAVSLPVPSAYVLTADAFEFINSKSKLKEEASTQLEHLINTLSSKNTYAVRSSAINEDGEKASFAGAYETLTDVKVADILDAVQQIADSADAARVQAYAVNMKQQESKIAVVIQRFVRPEFAGVLFTSDPVTGSSARMQGNYVCGEGELLVSGNANAEEFILETLKFDYHGNEALRKYARALYRYACKIRTLYQSPTDIEWAISNGKLYVLQARPITTLQRVNLDAFAVNGSLSGEYLLSKTNVGEIFTSPVSPVTFSILESICKELGVPCFIDNVCGQAYANISVVCSLLLSFGVNRDKMYTMIADIAGTLPEGMEIPVFPIEKKTFLRAMGRVFLKPKKKHYFKMSNRDFAEHMGEYADEMIAEIRAITSDKELLSYWDRCDEFMGRVLGAILFSIKTKDLLNTRIQLEEIAGKELAGALCEGCSEDAVLESMKPLLYLEKVIRGELSKEEYIQKYGHRSATEMELAMPYPYEDPDFLDKRIEDYINCGFQVGKLQEEHMANFGAAFTEFTKKYPGKKNWLTKKLARYAAANQGREKIRSRGVRLFCLLREYLKKAGELEGIGNDVFMLYFNETLALLDGKKEVLHFIPDRREHYELYQSYPPFPTIICGRFEPDRWLEDSNRRMDVYSVNAVPSNRCDIKGYAGAAGIVEGKVRVVLSLNEADSLQIGEILVTTATNIGWTMYFPRAKAIITDIGAPLSHAAIVAREFGLPAVVGCQNATTLLHTGDMVRVDGAAGSVEIIHEKSTADTYCASSAKHQGLPSVPSPVNEQSDISTTRAGRIPMEDVATSTLK